MTHRADWERAVAGVLRKTGRLATEAADHEAIATITRHTIDGIEVHPLPEPTPPPSAATRGRARGNWDIRVLADPDAVGLEEGATSVWIPRADQHRLQAQLEALALDRTPVILDGHPDSAPVSVTTFRRALGNRQAAPTTNLGYDAAASDAAANPQALADLLEAARELGVLAAVADATAIHDRGASDVLELAYALACGTAWLRAAAAHGLSAQEAAALLEFRFAATADQFATIAKLRAARSCWASLCPDAPIMRQHAVTSRPMMTRYDAHTNLLRTTVAAFSAAVGGADSITVLPYDAALGEPDADARRFARSISALLQAESHLGVVDDPAGGAPAVEALTNSLAAAALAQLEEIEAAGGIGSAGADAWCEQALTAIRERRDRAIATRRQPITGVSEFPLADESPIHRDGTPLTAGARSQAAPFEALRDTPPADRAFLATLGSVAAHTARATFAGNLLTSGGIGFDSAGATQSPADLLAAFAGQPVAVLAGSDADYAAWGAAAVAALRSAGARHVILAGKPGPATVAADLVDDSCAMGLDAIAFLTRTREVLS